MVLKRATIDRNHTVVRLQTGLGRGTVRIDALDFEPVARGALLLKVESESRMLVLAVLASCLLGSFRPRLSCRGWTGWIFSGRLILSDGLTARSHHECRERAKHQAVPKVTHMLHLRSSLSQKTTVRTTITVATHRLCPSQNEPLRCELPV